ncbi:hypothetical protein [Blastococcus sp. SYSU D00820]
MSYDALAASVALLAGAPLPAEARLSRRVRVVPLAVDRDDDVAATMFLRRGVSGVPQLEVHTLELTAAGWRLLGGGGGGPADEVTGPRPSVAELPGPAASSGHGGTARTAGRGLRRWRRNWISWAELRVAREVAALRAGNRLVPVAPHGNAVLVWADPRPPRVVALDPSGALVGPVPLDRAASRRPAW